MFGDREISDKGEFDSSQKLFNDNESCEVHQLVVNKNIARGVPANSVYRQLESLLMCHGVNLNDARVRSDYKIVTYLIQGMMDRVEGVRSDRCLLLDTLRLTLAYEDPLPDDTEEIFGDLLGRLN